MKLFQKLFSREDTKSALDTRKAIAFVDYEHWYYACRHLFRIVPDPISWRKELDERYNIEKIFIFGDFSYE